MAKFLVKNTGPLKGEVTVSGSKNAVLPIMAATLLSDDKCIILDAPDLRDVDVMCDILRSLGANVEADLNENKITVNPADLSGSEVDSKLANRMRASVLTVGPLLAKIGRARVARPGGCPIGERPIDLHLKGFEALGAKVVTTDEYVDITADKLKGAHIYLDYPSVGATENIMCAAVLAEGTTTISGVAKEPEIVALANVLNKMGARVKGAGESTITIRGVKSLHGTEYTVIPDRIEAGTYMIAAAITRGNVLVKNIVSDYVDPIMSKLSECGFIVEDTIDGIRVRGDIVGKLSPTSITTLPYPGFPTDMQSPFMALLTTIEGKSEVVETVFENRFMHVEELRRMGADIKLEGKKAIVYGGKKLTGSQVISTDLRAGAAMVLAGLTAEGETEISEIYHIERGYSQFVEKLRGLGAYIERIE